jgi:hypothetical protein
MRNQLFTRARDRYFRRPAMFEHRVEQRIEELFVQCKRNLRRLSFNDGNKQKNRQASGKNLRVSHTALSLKYY